MSSLQLINVCSRPRYFTAVMYAACIHLTDACRSLLYNRKPSVNTCLLNPYITTTIKVAKSPMQDLHKPCSPHWHSIVRVQYYGGREELTTCIQSQRTVQSIRWTTPFSYAVCIDRLVCAEVCYRGLAHTSTAVVTMSRSTANIRTFLKQSSVSARGQC